MNTMKFVAMSLFSILAGCSTAPAEPATPSGTLGILTTSSPVMNSPQDLAANYQFPLHGTPAKSNAHNSTAYRGDTETIVQSTTFGEVTAWSETRAPQMNVGWPGSLEQHDAMSKAYLVRVGIPQGEMGTLTHFHGAARSAAIATPSQVTEEALGFSTTFSRVVNGIPIVDSHAGVQLNANGTPVALSIAWPAIPTDVLVAAKSLQTQLSGGWRLPVAAAYGRSVVATNVVIRHSMTGASNPRIVAVLRSELGGDSKHSFVDTDASGNPVRLVEVENAPPDSAK